ncbi:tetratricopeptide repeat protein [Serinicoccus sediminis]|uniref:tetratricopeptide repeat protein n=1 Tax=Serinicoccus sediminis TaxID=2306021 RepID=UPI001021475B|nr:tetratricopeptide repeat protein [Serinicoccus sediminis]
MNDFYELLGIDRDAGTDAIKKAIREKRREARNRANHPRPETRAMGESMIEQLAEAEKILLDPAKRRQYEGELETAASQPASEAASGEGGRDWLRIAQQYLAQGQISQAGYAAREATQAQSNNPEAWYVRGQTSALQENFADAEFELSEALRLNPKMAEAHLELGEIYAHHELWPKAVGAYEKAAEINPDNPYVRAALASGYIGLGNIDRARPILEKVVQENPQVDLYRVYLADALVREAEGKMSKSADDMWAITSGAQVRVAQETVRSLNGLRLKGLDPAIDAELDEWARITERAETVRWHHSDHALIWGGAIVLAVLFAVISLGGGEVLYFLLGAAAAAGLAYLYYRRHRIPGWQDNRRSLPQYVTRSGLQD